MKDLKSLTLDQLHEILTPFEMKKGGPLDMRGVAFKATAKGKEKEEDIDLDEEIVIPNWDISKLSPNQM